MLKNLTIKSKILFITLFSLAFLSAVLGYVSVNKAKESLMKKSYDSLRSARDNKAKQVKNYFEQRIKDINVLSKGSNSDELLYDLGNLFDDLDVEEDEKFDVSIISVKEATDPHENFFQNFVQEYGYNDIYLINASTGHVLYSASKLSDYGSNLKFGDLKNSPLALIWKKTLENKKATFIDMQKYSVNNNKATMFLGAPLFQDEEIKGIIVFQISNKDINDIMHFRKGYGKSQEDYLVGQDFLMRSDSYLDPKNHTVQASFSNTALGQVKTEASLAALKGKNNTKIILDYNNNLVLSAYDSIKISKDIEWAILSEIDEIEVLEVPQALGIEIVLIAFILLVLISIMIYVLINKIIIKPLNSFQEGLLSFFAYLNKEKKEVEHLNILSHDEIGKMSFVVNENIIKTQKIIEEDNKVIDETISILNEFEKGDLSQRVSNTTSNPSLQKLSSLLNQMGSNLENNIENILLVLKQYSEFNYHPKVETKGITKHILELANGINFLGEASIQMLIENKTNGLTLDESTDILLENVDLLNTNANTSAAALEETAAAVEEITSNIVQNSQSIAKMASYAKELENSAKKGEKQAEETSTSMNQLDAEVNAINDAILIIDQIAFQTNILSLNAAVEAATAGEAGKGFAVVAQEVRNLANRSAQAAAEIKTLVENAKNKAKEGKNITSNMIKGYEGLQHNIVKTIELIKDVENSSAEQKTGIEQINDAINALDQKTQENAEISNRTYDVAKQTDTIAKVVVSDANKKEFPGKDDVKAKNMEEVQALSSKNIVKTTDTILVKTKSSVKKESIQDNNETWESF